MNMRTFLVTALVMTAGLSSCSKEDKEPGPGNEGTSSVYLKIEQGVLDSKAIETPAALATVDFTNGVLYFTDAAGVIKHRFEIDATGPTNVNDDPSPGTKIKRSDLTGGLEIKKIEATVKKAYLIGNHTLISDYPSTAVGANISAITDHALTYTNSQATINGSNLIDATLYGMGELVKRPLGTAQQFDVTIPLKPHIARIEIYDITGENSTDPATDFQEFNIKGVFVNNYYEGVNLDNTTTGFAKNWGAGGAELYGDGVGYPAHLHEWSAANFNNATVTDMVKHADGTDLTKVWAFNVFAPNAAAEFPHIILSVSNIKTDPDKTWDEPSFVTVRSFKKDNAPTEDAVLEAGKIYRLKPGYFTFNPTNLFGSAELSSIDVMVNITLLEWSEQGIKPNVD